MSCSSPMTVIMPHMSHAFAPAPLLRGATEIIQRLNEAGHEAYVAGGAVRDYLLGRTQSDLDIATSATPAQVRKLFARTFAVGESFGVILVRLHGLNFEVATFREECDYADGRHPATVRFSTAQADVARRDFTINGMLYDVQGSQILDWVGGQADIAARVIRTIGLAAERFGEDRLRMLRAVRFAAQLDFNIDDQTLQAICEAAPQLRVVSLERVRQELDKLWAAPAASHGVSLMERTGLWRELQSWLLEEARGLDRKGSWKTASAQSPSWQALWIGAADELKSLDALAEGALCAFLLDVLQPDPDDLLADQARLIGKQLEFLVRALRGSREEVTRLVSAALILCQVRPLSSQSLAAQLRVLRLPEFPWVLALVRHHPAFAQVPFGALEATVARHREMWHPHPLLSGNDMMALGITPGPELGRLMFAQEDAQLEARLRTVEDARAWFLDQVRATGGKS